MNKRDAYKYGYGAGYDAGWDTDTDLKELEKMGTGEIFGEIYDNWTQTDWFANWVVPEMKTETAWEAFEEGSYKGFCAAIKERFHFED
jgi:hypothetical protein